MDDRVERIAPSEYHAKLRARRAQNNLEEDIIYEFVSICQSYNDTEDDSTPATPPVRRTSRRVNYDDMPAIVESGKDVYLGAAGEFSALPRPVVASLPHGKTQPSNRSEKTSLGTLSEEDTPVAYNNTALPSTFSLSPPAASSIIRRPPASKYDNDEEANLIKLDRKIALMRLKGQMSQRGASDDAFHEWLKIPEGRRAAKLSRCAPAPLRIRKRGSVMELPTPPNCDGSFLEAEEGDDDEIFRTLFQAVKERPGSARERSLTAALAMMSQPLSPLVERDLSTMDGSVCPATGQALRPARRRVHLPPHPQSPRQTP
jgi:hypothetical protein